jgi:hypothetical protein
MGQAGQPTPASFAERLVNPSRSAVFPEVLVSRHSGAASADASDARLELNLATPLTGTT